MMSFKHRKRSCFRVADHIDDNRPARIIWGHIRGHIFIHDVAEGANTGFVLPLLAPFDMFRHLSKRQTEKPPSGGFSVCVGVSPVKA